MLLNNEIWRYQELKKAWPKFLKMAEWEVFITFTFEKNPISFKEGYKMVKSYFDKVKKEHSSIQFGALSVALIDKWNLEGTIHIHSLVYSNPRYPKRVSNLMNDEEIDHLTFLWDDIGRITIDKIYDDEGINNYITDKNIRFDDHDKWELFLYRQKIFTAEQGAIKNEKFKKRKTNV